MASLARKMCMHRFCRGLGMIELLMAVGAALVGIFVLVTAFAKASTGSGKTVPVAEKPKAKQPAKPKAAKKESAAKAKEAAEIDRLIAAQAVSVSGMPTDKATVLSLEAPKEKAPKAQPKKSAAGNRSTVETAKQRIADAQQGFSSVRQEKKKNGSPAARDDQDDDAEDLDRNLSKFFRQQDKRQKDKKAEWSKKKEAATGEKQATGRVSMSQKFTSNPTDLWAQGRKWE